MDGLTTGNATTESGMSSNMMQEENTCIYPQA